MYSWEKCNKIWSHTENWTSTQKLICQVTRHDLISRVTPGVSSWWYSGYGLWLVRLRVRSPPMPLDFSGGIFSKFLNLHCWRALSGNWVPGVKPGEGELGTGPGLAPVPLAGPKEQSTPGPRTKEPEMGAAGYALHITYAPNITFFLYTL